MTELVIRVREPNDSWHATGMTRIEMLNDAVMNILSQALPDLDHLTWGVFTWEITSPGHNEIRFTGLPGDIEVLTRVVIDASHEVAESAWRLTQDEMSALQSAAEALADAEDSGGSFGDVYDPGRSSSGEEYVRSPTESGFFTLVGGRPAQVTVSYVTDAEVIHEVLTELDDEHFETDSGTPPEADVDDIPGSCDISGG